MKVNYKSDFELTIQLTAGGEDVAAPSWGWQLRFFTCDRQAVYTVAYIDGKAERCAVNTDGTITAYFDKHGLMPGALRCEFVNLVPDSHYTHDTQMQVDPVELGVELWRGASDGGMDAVTLELAGQVLAEVQALAADLQQKAESGYFDGEPGPPGPAGPSLLVVTVTGSDQEALTADHTAAEILAEHEAGRPVVAVYGGEVYQLASVGASLASFSLASADLEVLAQIDIDADGGAVRIFDEIQGALTAGDGINIDGNVISSTGGGGTGIESIEQTVTSDESGGINVVTITMSDSTTADFEIMNGKKGDKGDPGPKGDSGVDLGEVVLVNDLTTGGEASALSAEMGKVLAEMIGDTSTYEVEWNLLPFENIVMGKKVTAITKASDNTIIPTVTDAEGWAYVIVTLDRTQHLSYGMCGYNLAGESEGFGFLGIVYNPNNGAYYTGNINATIARNANIAAYENAKIGAIATGSPFNIHQIAINIPCSSDAMQDAMANKTLGLFSGSFVPKTTCSTKKESHNIFDSTIRAFSTVNYLNSNYIAVEPNTKYVMAGAALVVKTYNSSLTQTGTIYPNQQPDYSELKNVYGAPYCTFTTGANDAYIMLNNQIGGTSGVTDVQWAKWQKLTIYKASLGYKPIAPHWVSKDYEPITPRMYDLAFVGDSITYRGWYEQMFTKIAIKSHYANGTNSIAWTSSAMESKFQALIDAYSNGDVVDDFGETIAAPQAIFVFLGTNADAVAGDMSTTMGLAIGSLSPTADRTQAMRKFIYMLRDAFPNTKIVGLAPYNNYNQSTIAKMVEVANAVESNYQYLGVKCWNLSKISGIMPDFDTSSNHTYLSDGIHPNAAGIELLSGIGARVVEAEVK